MQEGQPVCFAARALTETEQRYAVMEKECLAICFACDKFHQYIMCKEKVQVESDYRFIWIYLLFYVAFSQGHIVTGSLQVEETSAYCTVNHRASASNYQHSNMKRPARDSNRWPQRLEGRTLTATPPSNLESDHKPLETIFKKPILTAPK